MLIPVVYMYNGCAHVKIRNHCEQRLGLKSATDTTKSYSYNRKYCISTALWDCGKQQTTFKITRVLGF